MFSPKSPEHSQQFGRSRRLSLCLLSALAFVAACGGGSSDERPGADVGTGSVGVILTDGPVAS